MRIGLPKNCSKDVRLCLQELANILDTDKSPTFASFTLTDLTATKLVATDANKKLESINLTDHSLLIGSDTSAIASLGVATNGQLPIGSTGADPVLATLTGTANQIVVTNTAGSITLSTPQDIHTGASPTFRKITLYAPAGTGGHRLICDGPDDNEDMILMAKGTGAVYFNKDADGYGGSGGVYFYNGTDQKLMWFGGTTKGEFRIYDEDYLEWVQFSCSAGYGSLEVAGSGTPNDLLLNNNAHSHIRMFYGSTEGETKLLKIYGFRTGDVKRSLQIGIGTEAADTASFTNISNYKFTGALETTVSIKSNILKLTERSSDPSEPTEGTSVIWMSDGTDFGDDGDVCIASQAGGVTKKLILFDHSAGDTW